LNKDVILELRNITKKYPGVLALDNISLLYKRGEVHALVGENGAGKSTLIKIITGAIQPTDGEIIFNGVKIIDNNPIRSTKIGISAIYQEFNLMPHLSIAENVFFGREETKGWFVDFNSIENKTSKILKRLGIDLPPEKKVKDLSVAYKQIVEIAKSLSKNVKVLIMDEPSAALTNRELDFLFNIVKKMKKDGVTVIYISHRLEEIFQIADRVSVLRDGKFVSTSNVKNINKKTLIRQMVGRELGKDYPEKTCRIGKTILRVEELKNKYINNVSFHIKEGEIVGFAGLVGAGRTEVARAIFGADKLESGNIFIDDKQVNIKCPEDAIKAGIGFVPEDRKEQGLLLDLTVSDNINYTSFSKISRLGFINDKEKTQRAKDMKDNLKIKTPNLKQTVKNLSGGNQQKVIFSKWLLTDAKIIIFDEPTRGIDIGAKEEIYNIINQLTNSGKAIIFISSEMPELLGMANRIIIMNEGRIMGQLSSDEANQEKILAFASGSKEE